MRVQDVYEEEVSGQAAVWAVEGNHILCSTPGWGRGGDIFKVGDPFCSLTVVTSASRLSVWAWDISPALTSLSRLSCRQ